jgi:glycosyltransferase involved in cell wall biosynthesis
MTRPLVSVIVTCYNLGRFLDDAINSVLAQTLQDFEVVVVNDGSTEPETLRALDALDPSRTRVVTSPNRGLPAAKNLGLAHTTGEYVCALDADDRLVSTMFEKSAAVLAREPEVAFVSHWLRTFGDEVVEWTPSDCGFPALLDVNTVNGAALVRRSAIEAVGGFDETFRDGCEDWDLWIALVERGCRGVILPEVLFEYRKRKDSMTRAMQRDERHPDLYARLVQKHAAAFAPHLACLIARRERDLGTLRLHNHDLALDRRHALAPDVAKLRDDVAVLEGRIGGGPMRLALRAERETAHRAEADAARARADADALRASLSWRVTAPLRVVYERLLGLRGRPRS